MRKVTLFIAMSLDGFIADINGSVNWLKGQEENQNDMRTYQNFIKKIDTILMGWNTYYQIVNELSVQNWFYQEQTSYVFTHQKIDSNENIIFTNEDPIQLINKLKADNGKGIWVCGGANIAQLVINANLIDTFHITIIPCILGKGIRLFDNIENDVKLNLLRTEHYNGLVDIVYNIR